MMIAVCSNNNPDNIAWLCPNHHDSSALRSPQSKRITIAEIKNYRSVLYEYVESRRKAAIEYVDTSEALTEFDIRIFSAPLLLKRSNIDLHLEEVKLWASQIQFLGMSESKNTEKDAVWLGISKGARRYKNMKESDQSAVSTINLLTDQYCYLLLGDPGAGKTTTLKLIALNLLSKRKSHWKYPVLIRLRVIPAGISIVNYICFILGLKPESRDEFAKDGAKYTTYWLFGIEVHLGLSLFLESTGAFLLIDGLDEVISSELQEIVVRDIELLRMRTPRIKIILTCRAGNYVRHMDGFRIVSILPLSIDEQQKLATLWLLDEGTEFMRQVEASPYTDACSRPLLLTQLIVLFYRLGGLPNRPKEIYSTLLMLLLRDWDGERGIERRSQYASFDSSQKLDFLSSLAYHLTYDIKTTHFTHDQLEKAYKLIHQSFDLPIEEAKEVVREIESHNGIIVESSGGRFEFGHLSFQEFLCARHLVREPFPRLLPRYLKEYPAPIAVAISLSSNPSLWLSHCILDDRLTAGYISEWSLGILLNRLFIEKPKFDFCHELGLAAIELVSCYVITKTSVSESILKFINDNEIIKSIGAAMGYYEWHHNKDITILKNRLDRQGPIFMRMPLEPKIPHSIALKALDIWGEEVMQLGNGNFILKVVFTLDS